MSNQFSNQPQGELKPVTRKTFWFMFLAAIITYNIVAVLITQSQKDFKGFVNLGEDKMSLLFYAAIVYSVVIFFVLLRLNSKVEREIQEKEKKKYSVISYALADSIAIYGGLILFLLSGDYKNLILFSGLAIFAMFLVYPRQ